MILFCVCAHVHAACVRIRMYIIICMYIIMYVCSYSVCIVLYMFITHSNTSLTFYCLTVL